MVENYKRRLAVHKHVSFDCKYPYTFMTSKWQDEGYVSGEEGVSAVSAEGGVKHKQQLTKIISAWWTAKQKFKQQCQDVVDHAEEADGDKEEAVKEEEVAVAEKVQKMQPLHEC